MTRYATDAGTIRRIVRSETIVGIAINALLPTAVIWAVGLPPPATLGGSTGLVQGMIKGSGLAVFAMTMLLTLALRGRMRGARLPACRIADLAGPARLLPSNLLLRAIVMAMAAMVLLVPLGATVAASVGLLPLGAYGFVLFNLAFGTIVGLTMTAPVVRRALADGVDGAA